ncbi:hypothetical protein [Aureimonas altamirensis]|uniref:hypothetical protein n=1 Tax=Aureimonas altamirensis TaxID=370622 RepID=UPI00301595B8
MSIHKLTVPTLNDSRASRKFLSETETKIFRSVKRELLETWRPDVKLLLRTDSLSNVLFGPSRKIRVRVIERRYGKTPTLLQAESNAIEADFYADCSRNLDDIAEYVSNAALRLIQRNNYAITNFDIWFDIYQSDYLVHAHKILTTELVTQHQIEFEERVREEQQRRWENKDYVNWNDLWVELAAE